MLFSSRFARWISVSDGRFSLKRNNKLQRPNQYKTFTPLKGKKN